MNEKMELTFLGTGSAFTMEADNYQSNAIIKTDSGYNILIDCGSDIRFSLKEQGKSYKDIDAVYISHLHADHAGGLEYLGFCSYFDPSKSPIKLFVSKYLCSSLWTNVISGGMGSIQGEQMDLGSYFDVKVIGQSGKFNFEGIDFQAVQMTHVFDAFRIQPCFGLMFNLNGKKVFYTADTQSNPNQMRDWYNMADLIFHDCETTPYKSGVHAHYTELKELSEETKKKMWLYHYQDGALNSCWEPEEDGFSGFVKKGQKFS
ncbi:MAG: MBL fold metallo-hydrolase [Synergistaceae bacterium]